MKSRVLQALAALAMLAPLSGQAQSFGYSFVDFAVIPEADVDSGDFDIDGDGFQLRGSLAVHENFFALVEISSLEFDSRNVDVDLKRWAIGAGGHWPINSNLDLVARAGIVRYDVDVGRRDDDDIGFLLGGRARARLARGFELEGGVDLSTAEVDGFEDEITLVLEGRYHFNNMFSVGGLVSIGDDLTQIGIYGRYNF
jgi:hypothetical protein